MNEEQWMKEAEQLVSDYGRACILMGTRKGMEQAKAALLAHLHARPLPVGWMPIETAPEEGVFLVYMPGERDKERIQVAKWHPNARVIGGCFAFDRKPPSHWMPLPASPSSAALPVGEVTQDAKARAAAYAPWFLFGAQAQELAAAIKEDGCCHHWKEVVKLLEEIAASPEKESALPVGEGKPSADFDVWMQNPYTKVLMKSIENDYVPRPAGSGEVDKTEGGMASQAHMDGGKQG